MESETQSREDQRDKAIFGRYGDAFNALYWLCGQARLARKFKLASHRAARTKAGEKP
jgi:hypothetical protein